jgi:hypothetical protein
MVSQNGRKWNQFIFFLSPFFFPSWHEQLKPFRNHIHSFNLFQGLIPIHSPPPPHSQRAFRLCSRFYCGIFSVPILFRRLFQFCYTIQRCSLGTESVVKQCMKILQGSIALLDKRRMGKSLLMNGWVVNGQILERGDGETFRQLFAHVLSFHILLMFQDSYDVTQDGHSACLQG